MSDMSAGTDGRLNDPDGVLWRLTSIASHLPPATVHDRDGEGDAIEVPSSKGMIKASVLSSPALLLASLSPPSLLSALSSRRPSPFTCPSIHTLAQGWRLASLVDAEGAAVLHDAGVASSSLLTALGAGSRDLALGGMDAASEPATFA